MNFYIRDFGDDMGRILHRNKERDHRMLVINSCLVDMFKKG